MNIKQAKEEIKHTVQAYLSKDAFGEYKIPAVRQRPVLLIGPPGIGKTQIMEQFDRGFDALQMFAGLEGVNGDTIVFWFSTGLSACLYLILFLCAPLIAEFYHTP